MSFDSNKRITPSSRRIKYLFEFNLDFKRFRAIRRQLERFHRVRQWQGMCDQGHYVQTVAAHQFDRAEEFSVKAERPLKGQLFGGHRLNGQGHVSA